MVCEKPLATSVEDARRLTTAADQAGLVATVPFVYRFYPSVREARARIAAGEAGPLRLLHGTYLQDWLSKPLDSNWRVDPLLGGASRAFGDIGVHWCDLMEFVTGHRITRLTARMVTAFDRRPAESGSAAVGTEDAATVLFETDQGACRRGGDQSGVARAQEPAVVLVRRRRRLATASTRRARTVCGSAAGRPTRS